MKGLALLSVSTGALVPGFALTTMNGLVNTMAVTGGHLILGGTFTTVNGAAHDGLVSLDPSSGAVQSYITLQMTGHHNYGVHCTGSGCAHGATGITALSVSPTGTQMVVIGNFTKATSGATSYARDQVARILLGSSSASVDPDWATPLYTGPCSVKSYDSYVRGVAYSPDGTYFVIVSTGGGGKPVVGVTSCDSALRYEAAGSGSTVKPTWIDYGGDDTLFSVAITSSTVYVGGHQRWLNNANGKDSPGPGAVPRPGIAALQPSNGVPFSWNPGRNPRGAHVAVLYATAAGLWVGGDVNYVGNRKYYRGKDSFFPYAGGETLPASAVTTSTGTIYLGGQSGDSLQTTSFRAGTPSPALATRSTSTDWSDVRGAFMVDKRLIFTKTTDHNLYSAPFNGTTMGTATVLQPYNDPVWDGVFTGSDNENYNGTASSLNGEIPSITGLTYAGGYLFYTLKGKSSLYYRYFEPEDGIVGATEFTVAPANVSLANAEGLFISGGRLYWADQSSGNLLDAPFSGPSLPGGVLAPPTLAGPATTADSTVDWRAQALFLGPSAAAASASPTARFTTSCSGATCKFNAATSSDPGHSALGYAWNFGDNVTSSSNAPQHSYAAAGVFTVTLTIADAQGYVGSVSSQVTASAAASSPTAAFTASCSGATCSFNGSTSTSPTGTITAWAWNFGDGTTASGPAVSHAYSATGTYAVTLTVTDSLGNNGTTGHGVAPLVPAGAAGISYIGTSDVNGDARTPSVGVPGGTAAKDLMVLFVSANSTGAPTAPTGGWTAVGSKALSGMESFVYEKVATTADLGSTVSVTFGPSVKSDLQLTVYRGVAAAGVRTVAVKADGVTTSHTTPGLSAEDAFGLSWAELDRYHVTGAAALVAGDWVISYWAEKSSDTTAWKAPTGQKDLSAGYGAGAGEMCTLLSNYGAPAASSAPGLTATTNGSGGQATDWTLALAGS